MSWKRYQNELIVIGALLLMLGMYFYKQHAVSVQSGESQKTVSTIQEIKEVVALKKVWADKQIGNKVDRLKSVVPTSKVKWDKKRKKLKALYKDLQPSELNKLITKVLNTPVVLEKLDIQKLGSMYNVELRCKW